MKAYTKDGVVWVDANGGWSVQIPDPDAMPVLGVPPDGRTVEAEAFVIGTARVVSVQIFDRDEGTYAKVYGTYGMFEMPIREFRWLFGDATDYGETRRYAIVTLAEPQSEGETVQTATHEQAKAISTKELTDRLKSGPIRVESPVSPIAESPECGTEKVWLMRMHIGGYMVSSGSDPEYDAARDIWETDERGWRCHVPKELASFLHPTHNLQPGECCEVPARDGDGWLEDELRSYKNMVELGTRIEVDGERYLMVPERYIPLTPEEAEAAFDAAPAIPISDDELDEIARRVTAGQSAAPVPSAPPVDESEGPRWKSILLGFEPYKFIARIDAYDGYLVTCSRGLAIGFIAETGWSGFGWVYLDSAQKYFSETTGTHAELHKRLYDRALSANQLPPHPRYAKPEGAQVFLGWSPDSESPADFWWDCLGQIVCIDAKGIVYPYTVRGIDESPNQRSGFALALSRARELRLPERAAAQKRVAAADAELAAAKAALAEIGGGA